MPNSRIEVGPYAIEFHADKRYSIKWDLSQEQSPMAMPLGLAIIAAAAHSLTIITVHGELVTSSIGSKSADKYLFDTILPALRLFRTGLTGTLTLELGGGQLVAEGWALNMLADRDAPDGEEILPLAIDFLFSQPSDHSGLS